VTNGKLEFQVRVDAQGPYECNLEMTTDVIDVTTFLGRQVPNLAWEFVDETGHYHSFSKDGKLPTLQIHVQHMNCSIQGPHDDDECEGWDKRFAVCRLCAEEVEPKYEVDHSPEFVPGRSQWTAEIRGVHLEPGKDVSLAFSTAHTGRVRYFGTGKVMALNITDATYVTLIGGQGELARKK
jgi:hypothetical protein